MGIEIERKFLVTGDGWRGHGPAIPIRQGYLTTDPDRVVRVRIAGEAAFLTLKGRPADAGALSRLELEYPIPVDDAQVILDQLCLKPLIEKIRHRVVVRGFTWEVDEFQGENAGLVLAEIELRDAGDPVDPPDWIGAEVTADLRYQNANLALHPFSTWRTTGAMP